MPNAFKADVYVQIKNRTQRFQTGVKQAYLIAHDGLFTQPRVVDIPRLQEHDDTYIPDAASGILISDIECDPVIEPEQHIAVLQQMKLSHPGWYVGPYVHEGGPKPDYWKPIVAHGHIINMGCHVPAKEYEQWWLDQLRTSLDYADAVRGSKPCLASFETHVPPEGKPGDYSVVVEHNPKALYDAIVYAKSRGCWIEMFLHRWYGAREAQWVKLALAAVKGTTMPAIALVKEAVG